MLEENLDKIPNYKWMKHKTESKYKSSGIWNRDNFERILHEVFQEVDMIKSMYKQCFFSIGTIINSIFF